MLWENGRRLSDEGYKAAIQPSTQAAQLELFLLDAVKLINARPILLSALIMGLITEGTSPTQRPIQKIRVDPYWSS